MAVIENRAVRSIIQDMFIPPVDVGTFIREACGRFKERTAIIDDSTGRQYTYRELQELSTRIAAGLWRRGFRPGHMAGLHSGTNPEMLFAFCGVVFAGGSVVFAKSELKERELEWHFRDTCPSVVFCDEANAKKTRATCEGLASVKTLVVFGDCEGTVSMASLFLTPLDGFKPPAVPDLNAAVAVLFSTGTTGLPKGIIISHRNIVTQSLISGKLGKYVEVTDIMLATTPFTHVTGLWLYVTALSVGSTIILIPNMEMNQVLSAIEKYKGTMMFQFPTFTFKMLRSPMLERYDISSLNKILIGGSALPSTVGAELLAKLQLNVFRCGYGMTETFGGVTVTPGDSAEYDSVGLPIPMTEIKVVDVDTGERLDAGDHGEICIKGPTCSPGYFNMSENISQLYDSEGFVRTGDIGYYSKKSRLFVVDRMKEMIRCMERQVAPAELQEILLQHPGVSEAVVVGVPHIEYGEAPRAFIVLRDGFGSDEIIEKELRKLVEDQCAEYKHLHGGVEFVSSIPKSDNGKYLRRALRDSFIEKHMP